jgi:hypothetical protein
MSYISISKPDSKDRVNFLALARKPNHKQVSLDFSLAICFKKKENRETIVLSFTSASFED